MVTHFSILAWEIPWTEDRGRPQCTELQRVRHDLVTEHAFIYNSVCTCWDSLANAFLQTKVRMSLMTPMAIRHLSEAAQGETWPSFSMATLISW